MPYRLSLSVVVSGRLQVFLDPTRAEHLLAKPDGEATIAQGAQPLVGEVRLGTCPCAMPSCRVLHQPSGLLYHFQCTV